VIRPSALLVVLLLFAPIAFAQDTNAAHAERGRSLARILDRLLVPEKGARDEPRTLLLLLDPTASLGTASFAAELEAAIARGGGKLGNLRIAVARVGDAGAPLLAPTTVPTEVVGAAKAVQSKPEKRIQNVYEAIRRAAGALATVEGKKEIALVSLENGDAEDSVESTVASLRRSGAVLSVVGREAFLCDTYWVNHPKRPPRGLTLTGGDAAFVELPWGWLFQQAVANQTVPSGFAMYGLSRVAAASGGKVFLFYPPSGAGHRCAIYGTCLFCSNDHLPRDESFENHRLRALAPHAGSRAKARAAAARDPYFQAVLRAWGRASKDGIVRTRPSVRFAGGGLRPEKRQLGRNLMLGSSLSFSGQAGKAEKLAVSCRKIADDLQAELAHAEAAGGSARYRVIAELTLVMLRVTRVNLLGFAAFCREAGPELLAQHPDTVAPPEVPQHTPDQRPVGIGFSTLCFCHGVKPFRAVRLPGGEALAREIAALEPIVEGFLSRQAHTPFAKALKVSGIARFHFTFRGKYVPPPVRRPDSSSQDETATERPTRAGGGDSGGGAPTSGGR